MNRRLCSSLFALVLAANVFPGTVGLPGSSGLQAVSSTTQKPNLKSKPVYATQTGERFHLKGCRSLRQSSLPMTQAKAEIRGVTPWHVYSGVMNGVRDAYSKDHGIKISSDRSVERVRAGG